VCMCVCVCNLHTTDVQLFPCSVQCHQRNHVYHLGDRNVRHRPHTLPRQVRLRRQVI
jgi:hypothetical protein